MAAGSQPLAFAELAFGGLLLTSAITGETIGELLTNGLTAAGKERLHSKQQQQAQSEVPGGGESEPFTTNPGSSESTPGTVTPPGKLPPAPGKVTLPHASSTKRLGELKHGLEAALHLKEKLEREVGERKKSKATATKQFNQAFPWYAVWARELKALLK